MFGNKGEYIQSSKLSLSYSKYMLTYVKGDPIRVVGFK